MQNYIKTFDQDIIETTHRSEGQNELIRVKITRGLGEDAVHMFHMSIEEAEALATRLNYSAAIAKLVRTGRSSR